MKAKTSITLSPALMQAIDDWSGDYRSRSELIEEAVKHYLTLLQRYRSECRDREIIDRNAARLNREAAKVLDFQAPL
jgi:metal-responsive CopG/Arc/MetJ family transcriptional regulator